MKIIEMKGFREEKNSLCFDTDSDGGSRQNVKLIFPSVLMQELQVTG